MGGDGEGGGGEGERVDMVLVMEGGDEVEIVRGR
jgi:hypothetical protein